LNRYKDIEVIDKNLRRSTDGRHRVTFQ